MDPSNAASAFERAKVLITDDDDDIQKITRLNLVHEGFDVLQAFTGSECLDTVKSTRPDIILLDLMMPEMDGFETCKRLKSVDSTRDIPVIVCTAREALTDKLKCFSFKADDYLVKPYPFEELLSRIYLHLNRAVDMRERARSQREVILREVLHEVSGNVSAQYDAIAVAIKDLEAKVNDARLQDIKMASHEIVQVVEKTREREDPYYESPYLEHDNVDYLSDDEDIEALMRDLDIHVDPDSTP